jgi:hypothetical protein
MALKPKTPKTPTTPHESREARYWCRRQIERLSRYDARSSFVPVKDTFAVQCARRKVKALTRQIERFDGAERRRRERHDAAAAKDKAAITRAFYTGASVKAIMDLVDAYQAKWERS